MFILTAAPVLYPDSLRVRRCKFIWLDGFTGGSKNAQVRTTRHTGVSGKGLKDHEPSYQGDFKVELHDTELYKDCEPFSSSSHDSEETLYFGLQTAENNRPCCYASWQLQEHMGLQESKPNCMERRPRSQPFMFTEDAKRL